MVKRALVTGITGQSGSLLADLLFGKGYEIYGLVRPGATPRTQNIQHLLEPEQHVTLLYGDLTDSGSLYRALEKCDPHEVYNLGAQAHVKVSFDQPEYTGEATGIGVIRLLEALRAFNSDIRFYQASSSEVFGKVVEIPQRETTPFYPRSPYGAAKAYAYYVTKNYREAYGLFAANGILFNHESWRRGQHYVTRKISLSVARIFHGIQDNLHLGNLEAKRDWGWAPDYVEGIWSILQQNAPSDFVLASGEQHSVQEFAEKAFGHVGLDWSDYVIQDSKFLRPTEVDTLLGDYSKAKALLGWEPKVKFEEIVHRMVDHDMEMVRREVYARSK
jgi:GDPmannose 4,6-dehydratase